LKFNYYIVNNYQWLITCWFSLCMRTFSLLQRFTNVKDNHSLAHNEQRPKRDRNCLVLVTKFAASSTRVISACNF
jgi:hypothetical protein